MILICFTIGFCGSFWIIDRMINRHGYNDAIMLCKWISTGILCLFMVGFVINRAECGNYVAEIEEARRSIAEQRQSGNVENASLSVYITEKNAALAHNQRLANSKWFNWFWTDEVRNLKPLK